MRERTLNEVRQLERKSIEHDLQGQEYRDLLRRLQRKHPCFRRFQSMLAVVRHLNYEGTSAESKDDALRALLETYLIEGDDRAKVVILAAFWPALLKIHGQRYRWDSDSEERWSNVVATFLEEIKRVNLKQRDDRFACRLYGGTTHRLGDYYGVMHAYRRRKIERIKAPDDPVFLKATVEPDTTRAELHVAQQIAIRQFIKLHKTGILTEPEFLTAVGRLVYGHSLREIAEKTGVSLTTAKKRLTRARAAMRKGTPRQTRKRK